MKPIRYIVPLVACAGVLAVGGAGLSGCLNSQAYAQVGSDSPNAASFKLTNGLGKSVTSIKVKADGAKKFGKPLAQGASISADETVQFSCEPKSDESDLRVATDDGSVYVLHDVDLADVQDATLKAEGQTAYLDYTSTKLGKEKSTLANEKDLVIAGLQADQAKQDAKIKALTAAKEKAEAGQKEEAKKRAEAEKRASEADASKKGKSTKGKAKAGKPDAADSTDTGTSAAGGSTAPAAPSSSTPSVRRGSSPSRSSSSSRKSSDGSKTGASKKSPTGSKKSAGSSSSAAQKAAQANGASSEQQCTRDF